MLRRRYRRDRQRTSRRLLDIQTSSSAEALRRCSHHRRRRKTKRIGRVLMTKIDTELKARQATSQKLEHLGNSVTQYTLPRGAGELVIHESFYTVVDDYSSQRMSYRPSKILSGKEVGASRCVGQIGTIQQSDVPHSNRRCRCRCSILCSPDRFGKAAAIDFGKPVTSQTDILKVLDAEGFGKLSAVVGRMRLGDKTFDVYHDALCRLSHRFPFRFRCSTSQTGQRKDSELGDTKAASYLSTAWNAKDAFWKVKNLVDNVAGQRASSIRLSKGLKPTRSDRKSTSRIRFYRSSRRRFIR